MQRVETNAQTGSSTVIETVAWVNGGAPLWLDAGTEPPQGYTLATQQQLDDWAAQQALQAALRAKEQQVQALLKPVGLTQFWQLDGFMGGALSLALQQGMTEPQLIAANPAYAMAKSIRDQIITILSSP